MLFINTRPTERAKPLSQYLTQQLPDLDIVDLPLLELIPITLSPHAQQALNRLTESYYNILIVVSPTSARLGCQLVKNINHNIKIIAVGEGTAKILQQYNINSIIPKVSNNEGMLQLDCIKQLTHKQKVMIWRGQGGRELLINDLRKRQITVDIIELYQRTLPSQTMSDYYHYVSQIDNSTQKLVLITSMQAFDYWYQMVNDCVVHHSPKLTDFIYLTLGNRISDTVQGYGLQVYHIDNLHNETIVRAINMILKN